MVADLSGEKQNVYWEHGFAWALDPAKVITIAKSGTKVHFDLQGYHRIEYETLDQLKTELINEFKARLAQGQ